MIKFACTNCGHKMAALEKYAGKRVRCQKCKQPTLIPQISQTTDTKKEEQKNIVKFRCPNCNQKIGVKAEYAGRKVRCAKCRTPIRIPSPTAPKAPPTEKEPAAVLKAGSEQPSEESWGDFGSDFDDVLAAEANAPSIELEKPLKLAPTEETLGSDLSVDQTQYIQTQAIQSPKKKHTGIYIGIGAVAAVIIIGIVLVFMIPKSPAEKQAEQLEIQQAQQFAEDYITILENKEIDKAAQLLNPELQSSLQKTKLDAFAQRVAKGPVSDIQPSKPYIEQEADRKLFYFWFTLKYTEMEWQYLILVVSKTDFDMHIEELALENPLTLSSVSLSPRSFDQLSELALTDEVDFFTSIFTGFFCGLFIVIAILAILTTISMWIVFDKAGEPGWAAIVPIYNFWILAKVGDKPGWEGLALYFAGGVPFIGPFIEIYLWVDISIGVAKTFDRGILFGLGLFILPFIFYPILAFTD
jgi:DNA-directed RNA polymerase subunit RPC12/RpoP